MLRVGMVGPCSNLEDALVRNALDVVIGFTTADDGSCKFLCRNLTAAKSVLAALFGEEILKGRQVKRVFKVRRGPDYIRSTLESSEEDISLRHYTRVI